MNTKDFIAAKAETEKSLPNWTGVYRLKERTHSDFDHLRAAEIAARIAYNNTLIMIGKESDRLEAKFIATRQQKRDDCGYVYTLETKDNTNFRGTIYTVVGTPEYVMEGDEDYFKQNRYISFFIVNGVIIFTEGGGYTWRDLSSGRIISDDDISLLQQGIVPQFFLDRVQRKVLVSA